MKKKQTLVFPEDFDPDDNVTLLVPRALVPIIAGQLFASLANPERWQSPNDKHCGCQAMLLLQERLLADLEE